MHLRGCMVLRPICTAFWKHRGPKMCEKNIFYSKKSKIIILGHWKVITLCIFTGASQSRQFAMVKKITHCCEQKFWWSEVCKSTFEHRLCQFEHHFEIIQKSTLKFSRFSKFSFFHQLLPSRKNIFTWPISKFLDVLKSYESESDENQVYVLQGHGLPPSSAKT